MVTWSTKLTHKSFHISDLRKIWLLGNIVKTEGTKGRSVSSKGAHKTDLIMREKFRQKNVIFEWLQWHMLDCSLALEAPWFQVNFSQQLCIPLDSLKSPGCLSLSPEVSTLCPPCFDLCWWPCEGNDRWPTCWSNRESCLLDDTPRLTVASPIWAIV